MSVVAIVLGDFIQGVGGGAVSFFVALPVAIVTRLAFKLPKSLRQGIEIYFLYVLLYALLIAFAGTLPINAIGVLVVPNLIYLLCVAAISERAAQLWQGSGVLTAFIGGGIALVVAVLIRAVV